jgi:hypothetical protein
MRLLAKTSDDTKELLSLCRAGGLYDIAPCLSWANFRHAVISCVQKVYRADWQRRGFLGHSIHALAASAQEPFRTTGAKRQFPL